MFTRIGAPMAIEEIVSFDEAAAQPVVCKCSAKLGVRHGKLFRAAGRAKVVAGQKSIQCPSCGETTNV